MEWSDTPGHNMTGEFPDSGEDYGVPVFQMEGLAAMASVQRTGIAGGAIVIDQCLSRAFVAAYLRTCSARQAEAAVSESIQRLDIDATRAGLLSWKAIAAATLRADPIAGHTFDEAPVALPIELLRVARLSPLIRQCFVLRVLMAMPRNYCAGLLRMDAEQVDINSCLAAQELAGIIAADTAN